MKLVVFIVLALVAGLLPSTYARRVSNDKVINGPRNGHLPSLELVARRSGGGRGAPQKKTITRTNAYTTPRTTPAYTFDTTLVPLLCIDVLSACTSSALLSPVVTVIDKSVTLSAAGKMTLGSAIKKNAKAMIAKPRAFLVSPEYMWIWGLYSATYIAANTVSTLCNRTNRPPATPKFAATTLTNIYACVSKDAAFARMFGSGPPRPVPARSLALFSARDAGTVFSSFLLPPRVAAFLASLGMPPSAALNTAQLACPVAFQALSAPVHLLGLDLYNRGPAELAAGGPTRLGASFNNYLPVVGARMLRVLPAFGVGGIGNRVLRAEMIKWVGG